MRPVGTSCPDGPLFCRILRRERPDANRMDPHGGLQMLVLSRHRDERIVLYDRQTLRIIGEVCLVEIRGDKARLGFDFPDDIGCDRQEVFLRRQADHFRG